MIKLECVLLRNTVKYSVIYSKNMFKEELLLAYAVQSPLTWKTEYMVTVRGRFPEN